ncbi:MAG: DinB family protein [Promethearchaeota archaeon]
MPSLHQIYLSLEEERRRVLQRFKDVNEEHFYYVAKNNTWTPEQLFRHILNAFVVISRMLPGETLQRHKFALTSSEIPNNRMPLEEVSHALEDISAIISQRLKDLTPEMEEEVILAWDKKISRYKAILWLIGHEYAHLGQISWLLNRSIEKRSKDPE